MKVIEKVRLWSAEEMADFFRYFGSGDCCCCILNNLNKMEFCKVEENSVLGEGCKESIMSFLESESDEK